MYQNFLKNGIVYEGLYENGLFVDDDNVKYDKKTK